MSTTRHKSRIRPSRPRLRTHMMRTTTAPRFSMPGRHPSTSRLRINPTTACLNITRPPTTHTRSSQTLPTLPATRPHDTWAIRDRRTMALAPHLTPSWRPFTLL